ncbi:MAG: SAM-dependent methyltransferase [Planctomycetes bacterium]|nr:SAM-dependent methyltransferase [Planctomycetota bacterium]
MRKQASRLFYGNVSDFLFTVCQRGAEAVLKAEIARLRPELRFAFSRPGFVTFKIPSDAKLADDFDLGSVFARTYGFSLGRVEGTDAETMIREAWHVAKEAPHAARAHLHVWERDAALPGDRGFEPGVTPLAEEVGQQIAEAAGEITPTVNHLAKSGQRILDVVLVEPSAWWIGWHRASAPPSRWPGGVYSLQTPEDAVSRAYLKMAEALAWSRLPISPGDHCVELGSSPGGSCQTLLDRGCTVTGIDPAEMAPEVLERENFTHLRARSKDLKRRTFRGMHWLTADLNVAPSYTLETVEHIVTHRDTNFRGLLLTLKLMEWDLAEQIPEYLERVRSWGFEYVRARQLSYNRQEICVVALRRRQMRRKPFWREGAARQP